MNISILVIGGGTHHNTLGVIRALGERGYGVELITVGNKQKHYVSSSRYVTRHHALGDVTELADFLMRRPVSPEGLPPSGSQCPAAGREIIISCADAVTEQLNLHQDKLQERYVVPGVAEQGRMVELMDKTTMMRMAARRGIASPTVWLLPDDRQKVQLPCITKAHISSHGGNKTDIIVCRTTEQLDTFLSANTDDVFVQQFIEKREEVQLIGCSLRGGEEVIIPGMSKIIRSQPNTNTGFLRYEPIDPFYTDTVERAKLVMRDFGYSGLFSFEVLRGKDDRVYFLEVNFRNDGNAWCTTKAGINLPVVWVKSWLGEDYHSEICQPRSILMMPEFQDFKLVVQRKVSLRQWLKDARSTDYFMEYDKNDRRPFFQYLIDKVRR